MGQRLVINIMSEGETVANSYYHWSGYTSSGLRLMKDMISAGAIPILKDLPPVERTAAAVNLLVRTGASLSVESAEHIENNLELKKLLNEGAFEPQNRNDGLICYEPAECENNMTWAEATIEVYPDEQRFDIYGVLSGDSLDVDPDELSGEEVEYILGPVLRDEDIEGVEDDEAGMLFETYKDKIPSINRRLDELKFEEIDDVIEEIGNIDGCFIVNGNMSYCYSPIE